MGGGGRRAAPPSVPPEPAATTCCCRRRGPVRTHPPRGTCRLPHLSRVLIPWAFVRGRGRRGEGPPGVCVCVCMCVRGMEDGDTGWEEEGDGREGRKGKASSPLSLPPWLHSLTPVVGTSIRVCLSREALTTVAAQYLSQHRPASTHCKPITAATTLFTPAVITTTAADATNADFQLNRRDITPHTRLKVSHSLSNSLRHSPAWAL